MAWLNEPKLAEGQTYNLIWERTTAGVITIKGANGQDLSTSNPGFVGIMNTDATKIITIPVYSNSTFNDDTHTSSNLTNWTFNVTSGVAWNQDIPIPIFAINMNNSSSALKFCFGWHFNHQRYYGSPANLGDINTVPSTPNMINNLFIIGDVSLTYYGTKPLALIGATRIKKVSTADDWTFETISSTSYNQPLSQGAFKDVAGTLYTFPVGQQGARAGQHFIGANSPAASGSYYYKISSDFKRWSCIYLGGLMTNGTDGSDFALATPYPGSNLSMLGTGLVTYGASTFGVYAEVAVGTTQVKLRKVSDGTYLVNNGWTDAADKIIQLNFDIIT